MPNISNVNRAHVARAASRALSTTQVHQWCSSQQSSETVGAWCLMAEVVRKRIAGRQTSNRAGKRYDQQTCRDNRRAHVHNNVSAANWKQAYVRVGWYNVRPAYVLGIIVCSSAVSVWSPVSIQTQSLALRALRKGKPQETQALALANSQSRLSLLRPSIPIGWRLRLLREIFTMIHPQQGPTVAWNVT